MRNAAKPISYYRVCVCFQLNTQHTRWFSEIPNLFSALRTKAMSDHKEKSLVLVKKESEKIVFRWETTKKFGKFIFTDHEFNTYDLKGAC